jgi:hypothetical protein
VLTVAKDQNGCRFLQRKFDEGGASAIAQVFPEILDNLIDLMTDPFGNYLTQKLLDRCSEDQRLQVAPHTLPPLTLLLQLVKLECCRFRGQSRVLPRVLQ